MVGLRGRDESFAPGKQDARLEGFELGDGLGPDDAVQEQLAVNR